LTLEASFGKGRCALLLLAAALSCLLSWCWYLRQQHLMVFTKSPLSLRSQIIVFSPCVMSTVSFLLFSFLFLVLRRVSETSFVSIGLQHSLSLVKTLG
jgi:hypothetical protein